MHLYLLHGWKIDPNNEVKWQPLIQALKHNGVTAHFLALPGLSAPLTEVWTLTNYVHWLHHQLPPQTPVALLGHSFGGQLAIRYTRTHPNQVAKLLLIDSSGLQDKRWQAQIKRIGFKWAARVGKKISHANLLRTFLYRLAREMDYYEASLTMRQTMTHVLGDEILTDLKHIVCPTCIIWGERDTTTPVRNAHLLHQHLPYSQLHIIRAGKHSPQFTHTRQVAEIISRFINT